MGADSRLELALSQPGPDPFGLDYVPDADRDRVHVRVRNTSFQCRGQPSRHFSASAVHADTLTEDPQAASIGHDDVVAGPVTGLLHLPDTCDYPQAREQLRNAVCELTARTGVVHLRF